MFLDIEKLRAGKFDDNLLNSVRNARNFILVLTPNSLDRCVADTELKDWVHRVGRCSLIFVFILLSMSSGVRLPWLLSAFFAFSFFSHFSFTVFSINSLQLLSFAVVLHSPASLSSHLLMQISHYILGLPRIPFPFISSLCQFFISHSLHMSGPFNLLLTSFSLKLSFTPTFTDYAPWLCVQQPAFASSSIDPFRDHFISVLSKVSRVKLHSPAEHKIQFCQTVTEFAIKCSACFLSATSYVKSFNKPNRSSMFDLLCCLHQSKNPFC